MVKKLIFLLAFLAIQSNAFASIAFDAVAGTYIYFGSDITLSHTIGANSNKVLIVRVTSANNDIVGVTYNGDSLTQLGSYVQLGNSAGYYQSMWYILSPDDGTHNIVVDLSGTSNNATCLSMSLYNVEQQAPEATATARGTASPMTANITTITNNAWVVDLGSETEGKSFTVGENQTQRWNSNLLYAGAVSSTKLVETAGSTSMSWTISGTTNWATGLTAWEEASGGEPPTDSYSGRGIGRGISRGVFR